jgi:hypothetical protein
MGWAWRELGIVATRTDRLPPGHEGMCLVVPGSGTRGGVLLSDRAPYPRFTLAHEIGHLVLGNGAALSLACESHRMLLPEREANAFATMLLIADAELRALFAAGANIAQVATHFGAPQTAVLARIQLARLLGEYDPDRLDTLLAACDLDATA